MRNLCAALAVLLLATTACQGPSTDVSASAAGSYALTTVNGATLPATVTVNATHTTIYSGSIQLSPDGGVVSHHTQGPAGTSTSTTTTSSGTWTVVGSAIRLTMSGEDLSGQLSAIPSSGALTVTVAQGRTERFTK